MNDETIDTVRPITIMVEGCDRCGKTTLANALANDLSLYRMHSGVPPEEGAYTFYSEKIDADPPIGYKGKIFDRLFYSNYAYNGIFGGGVLPLHSIATLDQDLLEANSILILMYDHPQEITARMMKEGKDALPVTQVRHIQNRFFERFAECPLGRKMVCKYTELWDPSNGDDSGYVALLEVISGWIYNE